MYDIVIIGAGVVGSMVARRLIMQKRSICVLEKEGDVANGASKANSGIIHGGFDPEPGTLKARLNAEGIGKLYDAAKQLNVPFKRNGSLVCSFDENEDRAIYELYHRAEINGITGVSIIDRAKIKELEPNVSDNVRIALYAPCAGIISPYELCIAAIGNAMDNGVELKLCFNVSRIQKKKDHFLIRSSGGESVEARVVINCAGAYAGKISEIAGAEEIKIMPRAGEYMVLDKCEGNKVARTVFQVPSEAGKGILVTPTVDGNLLIGPTASRVEQFDDKDTTQAGLSTVKRYAVKSVPNIDFSKVITSFVGIRASEKDGDFIIGESKFIKGFVNVAAIDSPGLTCCVSIADTVADIVDEIAEIAPENQSFNGCREDMHMFRGMNLDQKNAYIKKHPEYGEIVCRCEGISKGEIIKALTTNPKANDVDGVKRRVRAGMGRCQGGFCMPSVARIISQINSVKMEKVTKNGAKSEIVKGIVGYEDKA